MNYLKIYQIILFFSLLVITFVIFSPMLDAKYARIDDHVMIKSPNKHALKKISIENIVEIFKSEHEGLYHPMVTISYSVERTIFGFVPEIFHFDNIMIHIVNVILVFLILLNLSKSFWLSFIVTTLFAIHPTRVEVVAWLSARKDTLYSLFYLFSILFYIKAYNSVRKKTFIFLSTICFLLACFSKAMAITLPFVLILIDLYTNNLSKQKIKIYLIYILTSLIFIFVTIKVHYTDFIEYYFSLFNLSINFINAHFNILFYFDKLILPIKLYCMYPFFYDMTTMPPAYILYSPAILYFLIFFAFLTLKKTKVIFFGLLFFLITILPGSNILYIGDFAVADRYTYIPYLGLFFIIAKFIVYMYTKFNKYIRGIIIVMCVSTFITLNYLSYERVLDWKYNDYSQPKSMNYYKFGVIKNEQD